MILFMILATIIIIAVSLATLFAGAIGGAFIFVFGDLIVCVALIVGIIKFATRKKEK